MQEYVQRHIQHRKQAGGTKTPQLQNCHIVELTDVEDCSHYSNCSAATNAKLKEDFEEIIFTHCINGLLS